MRRNRTERLIDVLLLLGIQPAVRANIMYGANLNDSQLTADLPFLLEKQLIQETVPPDRKNNRGAIYGLTDKGNELLQRYCAFITLLGDVSP